MTYYFDIYGWLTDEAIAGRGTDVQPPEETQSHRANWTGEQWVLLEYAPPPELPQPERGPRHITVGAFFDRFGPAKWAILADSTPAVQAVVRDASVRRHIDLDNPDLPAGLAIVQGAGHAIDPQAIIGDPVLPKEWP